MVVDGQVPDGSVSLRVQVVHAQGPVWSPTLWSGALQDNSHATGRTQKAMGSARGRLLVARSCGSRSRAVALGARAGRIACPGARLIGSHVLMRRRRRQRLGAGARRRPSEGSPVSQRAGRRLAASLGQVRVEAGGALSRRRDCGVRRRRPPGLGLDHAALHDSHDAGEPLLCGSPGLGQGRAWGTGEVTLGISGGAASEGCLKPHFFEHAQCVLHRSRQRTWVSTAI